MNFYWEDIVHFDLKGFFYEVNLQVSFGLGNGLELKRQQAIAWTNDDLWKRYWFQRLIGLLPNTQEFSG